MAKRPSPEQRREFGTFLSSRRARLQPKEFGLPEGARRTPGLRREEVAMLAGVSVSWYTWLEQDVKGFDEGRKRLMHPATGHIEFTYVALTPEGRPDLSLVTYIPRHAAYDPKS